MSDRRVRAVVLSACLMVGAAGPGARSQAPSDPVTFTEEQATRGEGVFKTVCLECHGRKDMASADFRVKWNGRTAFDLVDRIRSTMPESNPGALARAQYIDVTAYLAKLNGLPAGTADLPDDEAVLRKLVLALPPQGAHAPQRPRFR